MPFHIAPFPGQTYPGQYASHADIRAYLGFGKLVKRFFSDGKVYHTLKASKLPLDLNTAVQVPLTDGRLVILDCYPSDAKPGRKISTHRCYVQCPDCGDAVPAGRTHQHKCKEASHA